MKKLLMLFIATGFAFTGHVNAAATGFSDSKEVLTSDCVYSGTSSMIVQNVNLRLSANTFGAFECDGTKSLISVAACHKSGSKKPLDVSCGCSGPSAKNVDACPGSCDASSNYAPSDPTGDTVTISTRRAYTATTDSPSVLIQGIPSEACATASDIEGIPLFN